MRCFLATAATLLFVPLFVTPCHAQMHLPPVEYDKPYTGKLTIETVTTGQLRALCAAATQWSAGCAFPGKDSCRIILLDERLINAIGWTTS
jgi:hypothetical protein